MTRILFVGQKPETVDYSDPALPPGFSADKINAGIALAVQKIEQRSWPRMARVGGAGNNAALIAFRGSRAFSPAKRAYCPAVEPLHGPRGLPRGAPSPE